MAPGADVGGAANRQIGDASVGLRTAVKGSQNKVGEKSGDSKGGSGEAPMLSARERLRLHVNRNLAMQQQEAKMGGASDKGPASAGGPSAPPRGASPANSNTPPPTSAQQSTKQGANQRQQNNGLDSLYGPITDTRLGRGDISQGQGSSEFAGEPNTPLAEGTSAPIEMLNVPLDMSIDMADPFVKASPLASAEEETSSGFDSSDITETPPFIPAQEWSESALGENELGDSGQVSAWFGVFLVCGMQLRLRTPRGDRTPARLCVREQGRACMCTARMGACAQRVSVCLWCIWCTLWRLVSRN